MSSFFQHHCKVDPKNGPNTPATEHGQEPPKPVQCFSCMYFFVLLCILNKNCLFNACLHKEKKLKIYVQWHISKIFSDFSALIHFSCLHRLSVALALATVQVVGNIVNKKNSKNTFRKQKKHKKTYKTNGQDKKLFYPALL